ncbi:hypothetical protein Aperf_G00000122254 [Anoplocephala perfoliata]
MEYVYTDNILGISMNSETVAVCLNDGIYLHDIEDLELKRKVDVVDCKGVFALSASHSYMIAYSDSKKKGHVSVAMELDKSKDFDFKSHDDPLSVIALNSDSTLVASASESGQMIHVFAIPACEKLLNFQREILRAQTTILSFADDSQFLVSASNSTQVIHVYKTFLQRRFIDSTWALTDEGAQYNLSTGSEDSASGYAFVRARFPIFASGPNGYKTAVIWRCSNEIAIVAVGDDGYIGIFTFDPDRDGEAVYVNATNIRKASEDRDHGSFTLLEQYRTEIMSSKADKEKTEPPLKR